MFSLGVPSGDEVHKQNKVNELISQSRELQAQLRVEGDDAKKEELKRKLRNIASQLRSVAK
jgi:hypothetical protein